MKIQPHGSAHSVSSLIRYLLLLSTCLTLAGCPFWESENTSATLVINPYPETTPFAEIRLQGEINNISNETVKVEISVNSQPPIEAELENQQFFAWLKLEPGINSIEVKATINERYIFIETLEIEFQDDEEAIATLPSNNTEIIGSSTTLQGTFFSKWPAEVITVYINDQPIPFELNSQEQESEKASTRSASNLNTYQYHFSHWVPLTDGENQFQLKIVSPDSIFYRLLKFLASIAHPKPSYSINLASANTPTTKSSYLLQGTLEPQSGSLSDLEGVQLSISNSQTNDLVNLTGLTQTQFSANIPLALGSNTINVVARRNGHTVANASQVILRNKGDTINNILPQNKTTVTTPLINLSGEISTTWPLSDIQLKVNEQPQTLFAQGSPETFSFSVNKVSLLIGKNTIYLQLTTPDGVTNVEHHIIYQPTPDITPPVISLHTLPSTTTASTIKIVGSVVDPKEALSGISKVAVRNNLFPTEFNANLSGNTFSVEVPLAYGENILSVSAEDLSGNTTTQTINIKRLSLVTWRNLSPSNHSIISEPLVTISGELHVSKEAFIDGIRINQILVIPTLNSSTNVYHFSAQNIPLALGNNLFTLAAQGTNLETTSYQLNLIYRPEDQTEILAPQILINSPLEGAIIDQNEVSVSAKITSFGGAVSLSINGHNIASNEHVSYVDNDRVIAHINKKLTFPTNQDNLAILIEVTDSLGNSESTTINVRRDNQPPVITVDNYLAIPAVNQIDQNSMTISGSITDDNISSVFVNQQALSLTPSNTPNHYLFSSPQNLAPNGNLSVVIEAYDLAGNQSSKELKFESNGVNLKPLLPPNNATFMLAETANKIQVAVSYNQLPTNGKVAAWVAHQDPILLNSSTTVASGELTLPKQLGELSIHFSLLDENNKAIATASTQVNQIAQSAVPLVLQKVSPENGEHYAEPNDAIELYFNQKIDINQLQVTVLETLNGHTYINNDAPGTDFLQAKGYQLQQVFRNREPVSYYLAQLPNSTTVAIYPQNSLGYGANIEVEVTYKGVPLNRYQYRIRPLPTLITGAVSDQFNQTLAGIKVEIPALNLSTTTNADGGFSFGYQQPPNQTIASGSYALIINRAMNTPGISEERRTINVTELRRNDLGMLRVSQINTALPAESISTGNGQTALAGGDVKLDLSEAIVLFPEGFDKGLVYMQLATLPTINVPFSNEFAPLWAFATQPKGIALEGSVEIDIKLPKYQESYDYLNHIGEYMMLVAYQPDRSVIAPIGVAKINDNQRLISQQPVTLASLDYIGASWIPLELQSLAADVASGEKSLLELIAAITQSLSE